jgi:hypothetical protein
MPTRHRCVRAGAAAAGLLFLLTPQVAPAQSLGDVAARAVERRAQVATGRVYTDADLAPAEAQAPALPAEAGAGAAVGADVEAGVGADFGADVVANTEPGASTSGTSGTPASSDGTSTADGPSTGTGAVIVQAKKQQDEQYWRTRARRLRDQLARAAARVATAEARLSEINAAPRTAAATRQRETLAETHRRLQEDARSLSDTLARFLAQARVAQVPEEWTQ